MLDTTGWDEMGWGEVRVWVRGFDAGSCKRVRVSSEEEKKGTRTQGGVGSRMKPDGDREVGR